MVEGTVRGGDGGRTYVAVRGLVKIGRRSVSPLCSVSTAGLSAALILLQLRGEEEFREAEEQRNREGGAIHSHPACYTSLHILTDDG